MPTTRFVQGHHLESERPPVKRAVNQTHNDQDGIRMAWSFIEPQANALENSPDRIYTDFFNLCGTPFSITPDPDFLYFSETHQSVFERIQYGIQGRMGFMVLTGEVGTGKTTLCRALLDRVQNQSRTVYVINPSLSGRELMAAILDDLDIYCGETASKKELIDRLNRFLLNEGPGQPVVIIIDDAQTMPMETLEDLRLLSNLETDKNKLLQILLVGQPELLALIDQQALRQLKQRISIHSHLDFLRREEVGGYIERRLAVAGNQGQIRFNPKAVKHIHTISKGVPRMINKLCDLALTAAYTDDSATIEVGHVSAAAKEMVGVSAWTTGANKTGLRRRLVLATAAGLLIALALLAGTWRYRIFRHDQAAVIENRVESAFTKMGDAP